LHRWHAVILEHADTLGRLISLEQGKPFAEGRGEVMYGASYVAWFANEATRIYGDIIPRQQRGKRMSAVKEPVGIVAAITPWNFPLAMIARKIAPALAAGCTVVAKPAEDTPLTALALVLLAHEAGVPAGVINLICASRENAAESVKDWLDDDRVRKITFTGSTPVGKHLARESAGTLKKLSLELGGNAPFIVFCDADLDAAVAGLMASKFRNGGQTCVSPNRVYVQASVYDESAALLTERVAALKVAPATDPDAQIGPMINNDTPFGLAAYFYSQDLRRIDRVSRLLETGLIGVNEGAVSSEAAPFGGVKESGYGREGSKYGLDDYLSIKYLCQGNLE